MLRTLRTLLFGYCNLASDHCIPHPCPNLGELECENVDPSILVDVVRSRAMIDSISPRKCIYFDSNDPLRPLTLDDCIELNDVGVDLSRNLLEYFA